MLKIPTNGVFSPRKALVVDDEPGVRLALKRCLERAGYEVLTASSGMGALEKVEKENPQIIFLDIHLPDADGLGILKTIKELRSDTRVLMITGHANVQGAVEAMKRGAIDYLEKPIDFERLDSLIKVFEAGGSGSERAPFGGIAYKSGKMAGILKLAEHLAAKSDLTILLLGETGTGKNFLAREIHEASPRSGMPFVEIGCSGIPDHLVESELFGYEKGAFTDAKAEKKGLVETAAGGTLFLDEIGDMAYKLQSKILTLLDEKKFRRIGGLQYKNADARIIAATNRDLQELARNNSFRMDLFYRLNVATIELPPLRERIEDLPLLASRFLKGASERHRTKEKEFSPEALEALKEYSWPGNIRELKNLIEKLIVISRGAVIGLAELAGHHTLSRPVFAGVSAGNEETASAPEGFSLKDVEAQLIKKAVGLSSGNQRKAAKLLGITRDTLRYRLKKLGISSQPKE